MGGDYVCAACKPIATQKLLEGVLGKDGAEQIRNEYLQHEGSVRAIAYIYFLTASILTLGTFGVFSPNTSLNGPIAIAFLGLAVILTVAGLGLRKLKPWARIVSFVVSGFGLFACIVGTLINAYILYVLLSKKSEIVFSPSYQRAIEATPQLKAPWPIFFWIFILLVIGMLALFVVWFLGSSH